MSFQEILYIWLAVIFIAYISGSVVHIVGRRTRNLSGAYYHSEAAKTRRPGWSNSGMLPDPRRARRRNLPAHSATIWAGPVRQGPALPAFRALCRDDRDAL